MTAALIIASGKTDTSQAFTPLQRVGGLSAVQRQVQVFSIAKADRIVVVMGSDNPELKRQLADSEAICLHHAEGNSGEMLDHVKTGLAYLGDKYTRVLITPVDVPLFSVETVLRLMSSRKPLAIPSCEMRAGHPVALSSKLFAHILRYSGDQGLRGALKTCGVPPHYMEVNDEGIIINIQKRPDYEQLALQHDLQKIHPEMRLYLSKDRFFFGPGPYYLLNQIAETASLRTACERMGISYSKGWKMVENIEQQLGCRVVERSRGGRERGRTEINGKGRALLAAYGNYTKDCQKQMEKLFDKHFGDIL